MVILSGVQWHTGGQVISGVIRTCSGALKDVLIVAGKPADVRRRAAHVKADDLHPLAAALPLGRERIAYIPAEALLICISCRADMPSLRELSVVPKPSKTLFCCMLPIIDSR